VRRADGGGLSGSRAVLVADAAVLTAAGVTLAGLALAGRLSVDALLALSASIAGSVAVVTLAAARTFRRAAELGRTVEALRLRVRVADGVAERHRRTAETSGAGVFELLAGLVAAEEGARGQLAAELHDTVAQSLLAARMLLADNGPGAAGRAAECVDEAEEQVRAVMARTRPPELSRGDLAEAVRGLAADLLRRYGLGVRLEWPVAPRPLPHATAVVAYRFFQEALLNVVKHADTDLARAGLALLDGELVAEVVDAGPGFAPAAVRSEGGRHVGLTLLRERARLAGGAVTVTSSPGEGTRVELRLPLRPAPAAAPPSAPAPAAAPGLVSAAAAVSLPV